MSIYRTVNPFLIVKDADAMVAAYTAVLGATQIDREPACGPGVARAVVQIGDAVIAMTELLPPANYALLDTDSLFDMELKIRAEENWSITQEPAIKGHFVVMHAVDPAGITWIIQQELSRPVYRAVNAYLAVKDAAAAIASYSEVFGGQETVRDQAGDGPGIARGVVKVGDASIVLSDQVDPGVYALLNSTDLDGLTARITAAPGWSITQPATTRGAFRVLHATDPHGVTWLIQQPIPGTGYRAVNAYSSVTDSDALVASYQKVLGATNPSRDPARGPVGRATVQVGDAVIALTELLPPAVYVLINTADIASLQHNIEAAAGSGWAITQPPALRGTFSVMHATDPAGVIWIIQQPAAMR